ncbi:MAG TPA: Fe-S-containing hydro-lyase [Clostridia bacterium]
MVTKHINLPINENELIDLNAGELVILSGIIYTARDAAHKRITQAILNNQEPPFEIKNSAIYYTGPTPAPPGEIIGSCGPTSSSRMDDYTPLLLDNGLKIMIGKGKRSNAVVDSMKKNKAVYLCAVGGAAAIIKQYIISSALIAYEDLGTEAVRKLEVKDLPLIVCIDSKGNSLFDC